MHVQKKKKRKKKQLQRVAKCEKTHVGGECHNTKVILYGTAKKDNYSLFLNILKIYKRVCFSHTQGGRKERENVRNFFA